MKSVFGFFSGNQYINASVVSHEGHRCGIAKTGYYPEVVQHTNWDYGKNGKGYYNDILLGMDRLHCRIIFSGRAEKFLKNSLKIDNLL